MGIVKELQELSQKMTGNKSGKRTVAGVIKDISDGYSGGGSGNTRKIITINTSIPEGDSGTRITDEAEIAALNALYEEMIDNPTTYPDAMINNGFVYLLGNVDIFNDGSQEYFALYFTSWNGIRDYIQIGRLVDGDGTVHWDIL